MISDKQNYDENYYRDNNYVTYLERGPRYAKLINELHHDLLTKIMLRCENAPVLDYGCAVGFTVKSLIELGYTDVIGYDISEWAIEYAQQNVTLNVTDDYSYIKAKGPYELMFALDVFEHMTLRDLSQVLRDLRPKHVIVRIPLAEEDNSRFVLQVSENDRSHVTRLCRNSWLQFFRSNGFDWLFNIDLNLVYDTPGVLCALFRKISDNQIKTKP